MTEEGHPTEEELLRQLKVDDVLLQTVVALINLTGHKLESKDYPEAKKGIDAARSMLELCPAEQQAAIKNALSQLQMAYVQATKPGSQQKPEPEQEPEPEQKPKPDIWTPGGSS